MVFSHSASRVDDGEAVAAGQKEVFFQVVHSRASAQTRMRASSGDAASKRVSMQQMLLWQLAGNEGNTQRLLLVHDGDPVLVDLLDWADWSAWPAGLMR